MGDAFTARVHEATSLWTKALQRQLVMAYLIALIYAAEDRQQLFNTTVEMIFGHQPMKYTRIVKIYDSDGSTKICLVSVRTCQVAPGMHALAYKSESKDMGRGGGGKGEEEGREEGLCGAASFM